MVTPVSVTNCKEVHCENVDHCLSADEFMTEVLNSVEAASFETLPIEKSKSISSAKPKLIPGWSESVKPQRDTAYFWSQVWKSAGCPQNTELHKIMKRTRNIYHYHIRKCKKSEEIIKSNKFLDACLNGKDDIYNEIKKLRKCKPTAATSIDGIKDNIPGHFRAIYSELYNSVDEKQDLADLKIDIENSIHTSDFKEVELVTSDIIKKAVSKLKNDKSDPMFPYTSDCFKQAPDVLFDKLANLIHGHVTPFLLIATVLPIIKDKLGSISSSKNYRSIALSSVILKIIDWVILLLFGTSLCLDDLQFAYQPGGSTNMCTWAVIETIGYFMRHGSEVYACTMDMTKAFDLVKHGLLFRKLNASGIPAIFIRILLFIYMMQSARVKWNGEYSNWFTLCNGVRQGGVLSAILYCFYVNDLFELLRKKGHGCWIDGNFHGIFGYSDDNFLVAPSLYALQQMLITCEEFAEKHNLRFSTDPNPKKCKTKCLAFLFKRRDLPRMKLCGDEQLQASWQHGGG